MDERRGLTVNDLTKEWIQDPHIVIGYFGASTGISHDVTALKSLFNAAGKPIPQDLQDTQEATYDISRGRLANLVYEAERTHGAGFPLNYISAAYSWLRIIRG